MQKKKIDVFKFTPLSAELAKKKKKIMSNPVTQIDVSKPTSIADLVESFGGMSIQARNIGACAEVLKNMYNDKDRPTVMLGLAGPLIAGGLRKVIRDFVAAGLVDVIVSTGAIIYQDIYQARGYKHSRGNPDADDAELRDMWIDRIYDTYVDEDKFWETDCWIGKFSDSLEPGSYSSRAFLQELGSRLLDDEESILYTATKLGIPVFCPALNDSSLGIGLTEHYHRKTLEGRKGIAIDSIRDNYELTQIVINSNKTAAIYVAGGVPKNYINDSVVMGYIFNRETGGHTYAIQVTTDVPHWGGLSGSTLKEATSWGKINRKATRAMAFVEPTVSLPLLVGYCLERDLQQGRKRIKLDWDRDKLKSIKFA
ncbi:MAG: deoxyhypusine synthase family protein [Candidatus Margulisbacteria bacterium]|nr:deoxyhypusine synthase family protein [Candidatus Margulisiibacteriota bacterium]MBU1022508.1 deoxyhypusine synthase family protein [Candidatus Margulisiibacteriota bacterium]MBU1728492.1 deoxyhypusine synthase family protein [Candidatus Margulisiibacteriota bacterium]MBU1954639.1 deoxyhypusine synthase family protein [Candidatus Margulisiibacteriota bacterium]